MEKLKNILVFFGIPVVVVILLVMNGKIAQSEYSKKINEQEQNPYGAVISAETDDISMTSSEEKLIRVNVKNAGFMNWIYNEKKGINLSYHILDEKGKVIVKDGERAVIIEPIRRGEDGDLNLKIIAPEDKGKYKIELDMVHEGVTWFKEKGSKTTIIELEVK